MLILEGSLGNECFQNGVIRARASSTAGKPWIRVWKADSSRPASACAKAFGSTFQMSCPLPESLKVKGFWPISPCARVEDAEAEKVSENLMEMVWPSALALTACAMACENGPAGNTGMTTVARSWMRTPPPGSLVGGSVSNDGLVSPGNASEPSGAVDASCCAF